MFTKPTYATTRRRVARPITLLVLSCFLLSACVTPNRMSPGDGNRTLTDKGVVLLKLDTGPGLERHQFEFEIVAIDPATGASLVTKENRADRLANGVTREKTLLSINDPHFAIRLKPGEYALRRIRQFLPNHVGVVQIPAHPLAILLYAATAAAITAAAEAEKTKMIAEGRSMIPELSFQDDQTALRNAPRFTVNPGRVTYIGDLLVVGENRPRTETRVERQGPNDSDSETVIDSFDNWKLQLAYSQNTTDAMKYAADAGLAGVPVDAVALPALQQGPLLIRDFLAVCRI